MEHTQKNMRILVISGSSRKTTNYSAAESKGTFFVERVASLLPKDWIVDTCNLGNDFGMPKIQACNACVSTSMALCCWPCNCYKRHSFYEPDLMWDEDLYGRIYAADAILIVAPVYWYGPTSSLKLLFDRLVCANGGNPNEKLIHRKDANLAAALENSPEWKALSLNHLEGRTAAFFVYGDGGADEADENGIPLILKHKTYFDAQKEASITGAFRAYEPLIFQLRYSGIEVPDKLVQHLVIGKGQKYNKNQINALKQNLRVLEKFDSWVHDVKTFVEQKGKVKPGKYPVPLRKPDSKMNPFIRQIQLLTRKTLGSVSMHPLGYFVARYILKKRRLEK